jgi:hypothetical protein
VATSKYNIAGLKEAQGELEEARSLFLECEQICANVLGVDHEETLDAAMRAQTVGEEEEEEEESLEEENKHSEGSFERRCLLTTDDADLVEISSVFNHFP